MAVSHNPRADSSRREIIAASTPPTPTPSLRESQEKGDKPSVRRDTSTERTLKPVESAVSRQTHNEVSGQELKAVENQRGALQVIRVKVSRIRPFKDQPRKYFDEDTLGALADSLTQEGQQTPVIIIPVKNDPGCEYELVDGERRWRAAQIAGIDEFDAIVKTTIKDALEQHLASTIHNFHRDGHVPLEIAHALRKQMEEGEKSAHDLAVACGKSTAWVYHHLALLKLAPLLQKLLGPPTPKKERLRSPLAAILLRLPAECQEAVYMKVAGEKNPKRQLLQAQKLVEEIVGVSAQKQHAIVPAEHVKWLLTCIERLHGDMGRVETLTPSVFASLVNHRGNEINPLLEKVRGAIQSLQQLTEGIKRVQAALASKK